MPIQYADFAVWQRKHIQEEKLQKQRDYWVKQLDGIVLLELPTDHPRPSIPTFHGTHQAYLLPPALVDDLKVLSRRESSTLFMTLLAALQTLLFRYTGQTDVAIGINTAGRLQPEIAGLIGFFANTLVMRANLAQNPPFRTVLHHVRKIVIEGMANQDIPFEEIVVELQPERQLSHSPFFEILFTLRTPLPNDVYLGHTRVTPFAVKSGTAKFDLNIEMIETVQGLDMVLEYNTDLFAASTIHRMVESYQTLLEDVVAHPQLPISALSFIAQREREQLLVTWNQTQSPSQAEPCLHQLITEQAQRTPDRIALSCHDEQLSYAQLEQRANRLASLLQAGGVGPESLIAFFAPRSIHLIVGILAVFKAGGAYLPLDPTLPQQRLFQILEAAQPHVLFTTAQLAAQVPSFGSTSWLDLEAVMGSEPFLGFSRREDSSCGPQQLSYVIYTSGSTGRPKGVMINQQGMLNHLYAKIEDLQLQSQDCVAQNASSSFDISVWQMWAALVQGGRVHVFSPEEAQQPHRLWRCLREQAITMLQVVPSLLRLLLDELEGEGASMLDPWRHLRVLLATGEALPPDLCRRWWQRQPEVPLINAYGPTECSDDVTHAWLTSDTAGFSERVSIGRALRNTQLYVLDRCMELVPIGVVGELYVGGKGVGRGYLGAPEQTGASFVPDPWSQEPGERLYRTGDLVRYWEDGRLEYVGRVDAQVKLRGYRIELEEIEATLRRHPAIRDAAVLVRADIADNECLVAYVVGKDGEELEEGEICRNLQATLPDYMVPRYVVTLTALPLTANGKVDRRSLPAPERRLGESRERSVVARTPIEEIILDIYRDVLGTEQISLHESFFHMGGHSLLATQVISRLRSRIHIEIPLRSLFETPSVAGLAQHITSMLRREEARTLPPILSVARTPDLPLSFAQQRLWMQEQLTSGDSAYGLLLAVKLQGRLNIAILEKTVREIVQRHESLRTTFATRAGEPVQQITSEQPIQLVVTDLHLLEQDQQSASMLQLLQMGTTLPFDLARGPLLRTGLFVLQEQEYVFYIIMHHIIFDAWSTGIFFRELSTLYNAFLQGKPSPLLAPAFQYVDFALWQRRWLEGKVLNTLVDYWTQQLRGAQPLELATDQPRTALVSNQGASYVFELPSQLTQKLSALSRQEGVTLFMTLLTTFQILLHAYTGLLDIVVGTDIANRTSTETEDMIGFFINLLVLRTQLNAQDTFRETLKSVCAIVLQAYTHQELPFDQLVDALQLKRNSYQTPLVNILFVLQNAPANPLELHDLTATPLDVVTTMAKFDVAVFLMERASTLAGYVNYRRDLFHPDTIARMMRHFEMLLWDVVNAPDKLIEELNMFTDEEKEQRLHDLALQRETRRSKLKSTKRRITTLSESKLIAPMEER